MAGMDPTIVLVHGAFADASGFRPLYDELLGEGVSMIVPPNPLRGLLRAHWRADHRGRGCLAAWTSSSFR